MNLDSAMELERADPELFELIVAEERRQESTLDFIASENAAPHLLLEIQASSVANKVVEGMPGRRYHGGCKYVDQIEALASGRAASLFDAEHANVQPHSGVSANLTVYAACLSPGDPILSMSIRSGGHVSHGMAKTLPGTIYVPTFYDVDRDTELIDYENVAAQARASRPKLIIAGSSSYPREIDFERFYEIAKDVESLVLVDMAHVAGLVAAGTYKSPVPHADFVTATTYKTLRGPKGGFVLCRGEHATAIDSSVFPGTQGSASVTTIAGKALAFRDAARDEFRTYAKQVVRNARVLADGLLERGWRLVTGGTDTHIVMVDVGIRGLTGAEAQGRLERIGIVSNRNQIPFDTRSHVDTSGIRLGTAAVTARGFGSEEIGEIVALVDRVLSSPGLKRATEKRLASQVEDLCAAFPVYRPIQEAGMMSTERSHPNAVH